MHEVITVSHKSWIRKLANACLSVQRECPTAIMPFEFSWDYVLGQTASQEGRVYKTLVLNEMNVDSIMVYWDCITFAMFPGEL
jgi:hypothetical protein